MSVSYIQSNLQSKSIHFSDDSIFGKPTTIGYEKKFKWRWMATQLNTFVLVSDFGNETITPVIIENYLAESFKYASANYNGWPRGLQSGLGVIGILISENIDDAAIDYCHKLKSGKQWAGFSIPVTLNSRTKEAFYFQKNPMWGRIFYPYFKQMILDLIK